MISRINTPDFNLAATLECGQAFRWYRASDGWFTAVVGRELWHLRQAGDQLEFHGVADAQKLQHYLGLTVTMSHIVSTFPTDASLQDAVKRHWGLRVIRQEPWETLASFIASSTKQISQIRQIVAALAESLGEEIADNQFSFPTVEAVARASHDQLWACKLGFRAKHLLAAAQMIDSGKVQLDGLRQMEYERALEELCRLKGVGEKIANCTLLFSCGFDQAFPVDVWMARSIKRLYFPRRKVTDKKLREFARTRFGPYGGWAQQYLFYDERTRSQ